MLSADYSSAKDLDFNAIKMKVEKVDEKYIKITSGDNEPFLLNSLLSISVGSSEMDVKSYTAKKIESQYEMKYELTKKTSEDSNSMIILTAKLLADNTFQIKITDNSGTRFEVPKQALKLDNFKDETISRSLDDYITVTEDPFTLVIHEYQKPKNIYFKIDDNSLLIEDYFLSLDTQINTNGYLYGIGERVKEFFIPEGIYTTWSKDIPDPYDDGKRPGKNVYGTHPVYFTRSKSGSKYHWGMLNLNANAQDTIVKYTGSLGGQISHKITGQGIFDLYFFVDQETPESTVKEYHKLIGYPLLPPFYAVGWNQ